MNRRTLIKSGAYLALGYPFRRLSAFTPTPQFLSDPFAAGVASGDPTRNGVVLWTRLITDANREQAWQRDAVKVDWQVALDESMTRVIKRGTTMALPEYGHSAHVDVSGLESNRWYWYRFKAGGEASPVGRTKTAPAGNVDRVRFAFASCQKFDQGFYTAYQHMISEEIDAVVFLGDYIYETSTGDVRPVPKEEPMTLDDYRRRYALYRSDPALREAHRLFPWIITWDDHEVDNNYASDIAQDDQSRNEFLKRRAAAYQAHYEWLPMPKTCMPRGPSERIYRRLSYGNLANFFMLDGRQYRSDQACGDGTKPACAEFSDERRTMLGLEQEKWLDSEFQTSRAQWNILGNQVSMLGIDSVAPPATGYDMDDWVGYDAARRRLLKSAADRRVSNPIVITGNNHNNWVGELKLDNRDEKSPAIATEFVGTSITSGGDGADSSPEVDAYLRKNAQVKFFNNQRGYVVCDITSKALVADLRVVERVSTPTSPIVTRARFVVEDKRPGAKQFT